MGALDDEISMTMRFRCNSEKVNNAWRIHRLGYPLRIMTSVAGTETTKRGNIVTQNVMNHSTMFFSSFDMVSMMSN